MYVMDTQAWTLTFEQVQFTTFAASWRISTNSQGEPSPRQFVFP